MAASSKVGAASALAALHRAFLRYARDNPLTYICAASALSGLSVFAAASFAELTPDSAFLLMALCGGVTALALVGLTSHAAFEDGGQADSIWRERTHLQSLLSAVGDGVLVFNRRGKLSLISGRFREMFPELAPHTRLGLYLSDMVEIVAAYGGRTEDGLTGQEFRGELERFVNHGQGSRLVRVRDEMWIRLTPQRMEDGGVLIAVSDLTQMVRHELKLKATEQRFEHLAERLPGALFQRQERADGSFVFSYWSGGIRELLPSRPENLKGGLENLMAHVHPDDREQLEQRFRRSESSPVPWHDEFRVLDGSRVRWLSVSVKMRLDGIGRMIADGVLQDITERKGAEEMAHRAREAAEQADKAKSEFLAHMSHELRTPLNAIIGFSEMMDLGIYGPLGDDRYVDYARDIQFSGRHLLSLINDILDLSRSEAGRLELFEETVEMETLFDDCVRLVSESVRKHDQKIRLILDECDVEVRVDRRRVRQILTNLLSNASKFSGLKTEIVLGCRRVRAGLELYVQDQGPGMDAEEIERVMRPFNRGNSHVAGEIEGTGLGLPLSRVLAEAHQGALSLESLPGEGVRAVVLLPRERIVGRRRSNGERKLSA
ncbi:sensor histidine kinase [Minwuia thermotolerans]|uniref:histidine kinase n=1 Tax=Minwuia thermotolerans TaxID=2056226 RepID=A0A2M9FYG7_9PROT|nr:ATP-binding protein [Minwuia thermotolerans]PJK28516.1 hypothetical protein CVT23_16295 [Minwuia thermotolerans]